MNIYEDSDIDNDGAHGSVYLIGAFILACVVGAAYVLIKAIQSYGEY